MAERHGGLIKDGIRTMLAHCKIDFKYWRYAAKHFVYVWNRSHLNNEAGKTVYEILRGSKPSIGYLGVFGCDVYVCVPKDERYGNTFKPKMEPGIYLGHSTQQNCPIVFLMASGRIICSRDVDFRETSFTHAKTISEGSDADIDALIERGYEPLPPDAYIEEQKGDGVMEEIVQSDELIEDSGPGPIKYNADGEPVYEVEKILKKRIKFKKAEYFVQWLGYPESENSWEPVASLQGCRKLVEEFEQQNKLEKVKQHEAPQPRMTRSKAKAAADSQAKAPEPKPDASGVSDSKPNESKEEKVDQQETKSPEPESSDVDLLASDKAADEHIEDEELDSLVNHGVVSMILGAFNRRPSL
jgi:hypothetical protein